MTSDGHYAAMSFAALLNGLRKMAGPGESGFGALVVSSWCRYIWCVTSSFFEEDSTFRDHAARTAALHYSLSRPQANRQENRKKFAPIPVVYEARELGAWEIRSGRDVETAWCATNTNNMVYTFSRLTISAVCLISTSSTMAFSTASAGDRASHATTRLEISALESLAGELKTMIEPLDDLTT